MREIGIAMIGTGFMAKVHSVAISSYPKMHWPPVAMPVRQVICSREAARARESAARFGYAASSADYREAVCRLDVDLVVIVTENDTHASVALAAMEAGKHVLCEKPLARNVQEAQLMCDMARKTGVKTMVAFNYRRLPAIKLAHTLLAEGRLGKPVTYRCVYYQDFGADGKGPFAWRNSKAAAGSGALGDIGTHIMDITRYLVGEVAEVNGCLRTVHKQRPSAEEPGKRCPVDVDDEFTALLRFENGCEGTLAASKNAWGRNNFIGFELFCEKGAIRFNLERAGELDLYLPEEDPRLRGFRTIYTNERHPTGEFFWPLGGMGIGYAEPPMVQLHDLLYAIVHNTDTSPSFADGLRIARLCGAIERSGQSGTWESV